MRGIYAGKKDGSKNGSARSRTGIMGTESTGEEVLAFYISSCLTARQM